MANPSADIDARAKYRKRSGRGVYKKTDTSICAQITITEKNLALGTFNTLAAARAKRATVLKQVKKNGAFSKQPSTVGRDKGVYPHKGGYQVVCYFKDNIHSAPTCRTKGEDREARDKLYAKVGKALR